MPLIQWLLNLEPIQSVSVKPSKSTVLDVSETPLLTADDVYAVPSTVLRPDVVETPQLRREASGSFSVNPRPSSPPVISTKKPSGQAVLIGAKRSGSSLTSASVSGKPTIKRRS